MKKMLRICLFLITASMRSLCEMLLGSCVILLLRMQNGIACLLQEGSS